jgi:chromosome segregation protein
MYLKKLEISGFKSFASKTTLDFCPARNAPSSDADGNTKNKHDAGVTVIVGPNGSGKSNVADAVRWVMGEQSMKNLRGKKSEDIIFAGSGKKARLGSAGVTMYLDNSDRKMALDFNEVAVTRKIHRSGESEFLINGSKVRLQDIVDTLAKAGLGKESYTIINQGMADAVLNASPIERRTVIEDAAGVKQYQIKKERSIRKLDSTRDNLDRAKDLAEEIKPHLRMLKRQADKAAQSEEVVKELKDKQNKLYSYLWHNFQSEKNKFNEEKEEAGRRMMNIQREVDKLTDEINKESKENGENSHLADLEKKLREEKNKLSQFDRDLIITEGRIEIEKEKEKNRAMIEEIQVKSITVDTGYIKSGIEEIKREQEILIKRLEQAEKMEDLQDIREFARVIAQKLHDLKADIEKGRREEKIEKIENKAEVLKLEKKEDKSALIELKEKTIKLREEIKKTEEEIKKTEKEIQEEISSDREKRQKFFELERKLRTKQDELNKLKDLFNESKITLAKIEVREDDLKNEVRNELKKEADELEKAEEGVNRGELEHEISKLKIKWEQIGGIDPLVVSEYEETKNRFEFLTHESADLENAIVSLKEVIREMDEKIKKSFEETFSEINKEFTKYFRIIFGGGQAHLAKLKITLPAGRQESSKLKVAQSAILSEAKDLGEPVENGDELKEDGKEEDNREEEREEIGIEIFACPPGKRISNLSMLSGGERSLTSLALLFAIISHNPPPFSILDEVEAALDEANSKRFSRILTELSKDTQFVIISHNRETMRQASLLYGVTMGEDGISKLLSVRLDQVGQGGKILK